MYRKFIELINALYLKIRAASSVYTIFFIILAIAYLPLLSFRMSLKNDALTLSYPLFYFFSEQLRQGIIPWWHPNLHLGFPLHADPGFPFFSPITWIWALIGSNLYVFTLMLWSYVMIGGAGMIRLTRYLGLSPMAQLFVSLSYLASGYYASHLQHPHYLFETAFIPFLLLFTIRLIYVPRLKESIYLAMTLFFLVNSGYPSFVLSSGYFLLILVISIFATDRSLQSARSIQKIALYAAISAVIAILLCLPYIASVIDIYPLFNRIGEASFARNAFTGGITLRSLVSLLFPLASVTDPAYIGTDSTWSNAYTGLFTLIFFAAGLLAIRQRLKTPLLIAGLVLLALSFQGAVKALFYLFVPFFGLMVSNGGLRIYFLLMVSLIAGWGADAFLQHRATRTIRLCGGILALVLASTAIAGLLKGWENNSSADLAGFFKTLPFRNALIVQSLISLAMLATAWLYCQRPKAIIAIGMAEIILSFWINLPYSGLGMSSTADSQRHIREVTETRKSVSPYAIIGEISRRPAIADKIIREPLFYSQAIGMMPLSSYPSAFRSYHLFAKNQGLDSISGEQFVFSLNQRRFAGIRPKLSVDSLQVRAGHISFTVSAHTPHDTLVILQNNASQWRFLINGKPTRQGTAMGTFIGIPAEEGRMSVSGEYRPMKIMVCFAISTFAWLLLLILPFVSARKTI